MQIKDNKRREKTDFEHKHQLTISKKLNKLSMLNGILQIYP